MRDIYIINIAAGIGEEDASILRRYEGENSISVYRTLRFLGEDTWLYVY